MYFSTKEIIDHRHVTIRVASSGKSELILNNRNMEVLLPEAKMMEKKEKMKQDSEYRHTCRALPQSLLYMRLEGTIVYYTDQTRTL
jgi:hypothetical protein